MYSLATVSSLTLSNTSIASFSDTKERNVVSNVRVWIVRGDWPCSVMGIRDTSEMSGYGTFGSREATGQSTSARNWLWTDPHLLPPLLVVVEDRMVCGEMQRAGGGAPALGAQHALDLQTAISLTAGQTSLSDTPLSLAEHPWSHRSLMQDELAKRSLWWSNGDCGGTITLRVRTTVYAGASKSITRHCRRDAA